MSKTVVYSCGRGWTGKQLYDHVISLAEGETMALIDCDGWYPEMKFHNGNSYMLTEHEQVDVARGLVGNSIVTVSETIILTLLREVRMGRLKYTDLELWCGDSQIEIDEDGSLLDHWDGGFFETGFQLRFIDE